MPFSSEHVDELTTTYRDGLLHDTLPFWIRHSVDRQHGGFITSLDRDGQILDDDKGVWQQGRFTWLLGKMYNTVEAREEWLELALHGAGFLDEFCFDQTDGRMWFHVARDGRPIRKRRYAFSESFAAIAYGEVAKATGKQEYADKAQDAFLTFVHHNPAAASSTSKFEPTRPTRALGPSMISLVTAQELRQSIDLPSADEWIDQSLDTIQTLHVDRKTRCVFENVGTDGEFLDHFDGRTLNPGHAIEAAWFILNEGRHRKDQQLIELGAEMLTWMWERGWDDDFGGIMYFVDVHGKPVQEYWHDMKFWWPQNEAIIATLLAAITTGEQKFADWHTQVHNWAYKHFPDRRHGEWFGYLHRDGRISSALKGNLWKGPFHLPRMQLICWQLLEEFRRGSHESAW